MFPLTTLASACPPKMQLKIENPIMFIKFKIQIKMTP